MQDPVLTRIIATLGPASSEPEVIADLIEAGVSIFRLNFSHGTIEEHAERVSRIRAAATALERPIAILGDLPGPKIRVGTVPGDGFDVTAGAEVSFDADTAMACRTDDAFEFGVTYPGLATDVKPGERLLVNDGAVRMLVVSTSPDRVQCTVTHGGLISSGKGVNLPDTDVGLDTLTERDRRFARWSMEHELDFLGLSFVRRADDLRALAEETGGTIPVVAKIEQPRAVENIEEITDAADAIMVARGDLGVEMDLARVPVIQKQIIRTAQGYGKPCIVATQMLETMINSAQPTRAEASDVANAIFDQVDAVMLSGETAVGRFPVVAVETMRRIAACTEAAQAEEGVKVPPPRRLYESNQPLAALAHGVSTVARDCEASFIVAWSQSGASAMALSRNYFHIPIVAISSDDRTLRQMQLLRGVVSQRMDIPENLARFTQMVDAFLLESGHAEAGARGILVVGWPIGPDMVTNSLAIHHVGDPSSGFAWHQ